MEDSIRGVAVRDLKTCCTSQATNTDEILCNNSASVTILAVLPRQFENWLGPEKRKRRTGPQCVASLLDLLDKVCDEQVGNRLRSSSQIEAPRP
jgi:hypothetical protein